MVMRGDPQHDLLLFVPLLEQLPNAQWLVDASGAVVYANTQARALWRFPEHQELPCTALTVRAYDTDNGTPVDLYPKESQKILQTHELPAPRDFRVERPDGTKAYIAHRAVALPDVAGELQGVLFVEEDISQQHRCGEIRSAARRFRRALQGSPVIIFVLDQTLRCTAARTFSPALNASDFLGKRLEEFAGGDQMGAFVLLVRDVLRTHRQVRHEIHLVRPEPQSDCFLDVSIGPLANAQGKVNEVNCFAWDITHLKSVETTLHNNELRFRSLVEGSTDPILLLDQKGVVIAASTPAADLLGYTVGELRGLNIHSRIHPVDAATAGAMAQRLKTREMSTINLLLRLRKKNENLLWADCEVTSMLAAGNSLGYIFKMSALLVHSTQQNRE